jgi:hypothetical protein
MERRVQGIATESTFVATLSTESLVRASGDGERQHDRHQVRAATA